MNQLLQASWQANVAVGSYKGLTIANVTLIAFVISQADRTVGMTFQLEDGTGNIEGVLYREDQRATYDEEEIRNYERKYVKVRSSM